MSDAPDQNKDIREKAERLRAAFDDYLRELGVLRKERRDLIEGVIKRIEKEKMDSIMNDLKSS